MGHTDIAGQHDSYAYTGTRLDSIVLGDNPIAHTSGPETDFAYRPDGLLQTVTLPGPERLTWTIGYDAQGRVHTITSLAVGAVGGSSYGAGVATTITYRPAAAGGMAATDVTEGDGTRDAVATTYTYDVQGQVRQIRDAAGHSDMEYDAFHDVSRAVDARGNATTYDYGWLVDPNTCTAADAGPCLPLGGTAGTAGTGGAAQPALHPSLTLLKTVTPPPLGDVGAASVATGYVVDPLTHDLTEVDRPRGGVTRYTYNIHHQALTTAQLVSRAHGATGAGWRGTVAHYDQWGNPDALTDGRGVTVRDDGAGNPVVSTDTDPAYTTGWSYRDNGDLDHITSPAIPIAVTDAAGGAAFNGDGSPHTITARVVMVQTHDDDGNLTGVRSPNGSDTDEHYDHLGRLYRTDLPPVALQGEAATFGRPVVSLGYDGAGNVVTVARGQYLDPSGAPAGNALTTRYLFDALGRAIGTIDPDGHSSAATYTSTHQGSATDARGNVTAYGYDGADRLTGQVLPDPNGVAGSDPTPRTIGYGVDAVGNTVAITTPLSYYTVDSTAREVRTYNSWNLLQSDRVGDAAGLGPLAHPRTVTQAYDADGNVTTRSYSSGGQASAYTYDLADEPLGVRIGPGPLEGQDLGYDAAGHATLRCDFGQYSHVLVYDGADRLTQRQDGTLPAPGSCQGAASFSPLLTDLAYDADGNPVALA